MEIQKRCTFLQYLNKNDVWISKKDKKTCRILTDLDIEIQKRHIFLQEIGKNEYQKLKKTIKPAGNCKTQKKYATKPNFSLGENNICQKKTNATTTFGTRNVYFSAKK